MTARWGERIAKYGLLAYSFRTSLRDILRAGIDTNTARLFNVVCGTTDTYKYESTQGPGELLGDRSQEAMGEELISPRDAASGDRNRDPRNAARPSLPPWLPPPSRGIRKTVDACNGWILLHNEQLKLEGQKPTSNSLCTILIEIFWKISPHLPIPVDPFMENNLLY